MDFKVGTVVAADFKIDTVATGFKTGTVAVRTSKLVL